MTATLPGEQATGFRPRRLAHVNLFVTQLARSLDFYTRICGLDIVFEEPGISAVFLSNGNSHHDLALMEITNGERVGRDGNVQVSRARGRAAGLNHLGFEMHSEADLVNGIRAARAGNATLHRTVDHQISRSAYLFDPDGTYLEMYADSTDDWRQTYRDNQGQLITGDWDPESGQPDTRERFTAEPRYTVMDDAALRPLRTSRAAVAVTDLDRAVSFYRRIVGLTVLRGGQDGAVLGGALGLPDVTLLRATDAVPVGLSHFGLELSDEDELDEGLQRAVATGGRVVATVDNAYKKSLVLRDPDGVLVEFLVDRARDAEVEEPSAATRFAV